MRTIPQAIRQTAGLSKPLEREPKGIRVAWCPDLGGLPLEPEVRAVLDAQRATLERLGCIVEECTPDLTGADEAFLTLRAWHSWSNLGALLDRHRGEMKQEAITEIEKGGKFSGGDIARAMTLQTQVMASMRNFQRNYDYVLCAVNQAPPFDAKITWPQRDRGYQYGALHRVDEIGLLDHRHGLPGDLGAGGVYDGRSARRSPDRRTVSGGLRAAAVCAHVRAGDTRGPAPARAQNCQLNESARFLSTPV
jgi:Asp-tRNA(Asn)/Glu-tRNA(Gln) amidotransferase A subunit family amidase